ncbi:ATP-binding cassette domain-containing protein [Anaerocolumna sp.]|uniref:ABC transporter ATP-binding protein n=1 Tax=Anaerocolumna sp. TaxID=2041569 RepID=UPI002F3E40D4
MQNQVETVIQVKNVKKIYRMGTERIFAVDDVSFDILKGEFCCLLGTSGSGKSTLLNLMAGIEKLSAGQIIIKGKKIHRMNESSLARFRQRYLGFVFQSYNLINSMTALENVEFPLVFKRVKAKKRKSLAKDMLKKVGLGNRVAHKPKEMSGGQQQRVGIARAFVAKPEIVFADEPTGNLDTKTTMEVMGLIRQIAKENKQTIVMVTHDRRLAEFADKIIHILDGKIQDIEIRRDITQNNDEDSEQSPEGTENKPDVKINVDANDNVSAKNSTVAKTNVAAKDNAESKNNVDMKTDAVVKTNVDGKQSADVKRNADERVNADEDRNADMKRNENSKRNASTKRKNANAKDKNAKDKNAKTIGNSDTRNKIDVGSTTDTKENIDSKSNTDTELDIKIDLDGIFDMNVDIVYPEEVDSETPSKDNNIDHMSDIASTKE